jgi:hypothetical protein
MAAGYFLAGTILIVQVTGKKRVAAQTDSLFYPPLIVIVG